MMDSRAMEEAIGLRASTSPSANPRDPVLAQWWGISQRASSGESVTPETALNLSVYFACVRNISEDVAKLPFIVYERVGERGKRRQYSHPAYRLMHDEPNQEMTAVAFRETMTHYAMTHGGAFAEIVRDGAGRPAELYPIEPHRVKVQRVSGRLVYEVSGVNAKHRTLEARDVLHVHGLGSDGVTGYSVARVAMESLGSGLALQRFANQFFGNGAMPSSVLEHPGKMSKEAQDRLRGKWEMAYGANGDRRNGMAILEEGMKLSKFSINPDEAQFIESRQFSVVDICRWFRMPPHKVQDLSRATFSNIEHQSIDYVGDTLMPWLVRWEQEVNRKLLTADERLANYTQHLVQGILRSDIATRYNAHSIGRQWGWLSANDVREIEDMDQLPGEDGDIYLVPLNMTTPAGLLAQIEGEATDKPDPPPTDPPTDPQDGNSDDVVAAARSAVVAELGRMIRREAQAARSAAKKPAEFIAWLDEWYAKQSRICAEALAPVLRTWNAATGRDVSAEAFAADHVSLSKNELLDACGRASPACLLSAIEETVTAWEADRASDFVELSLGEVSSV